ncbi:MAG TPA: pyridoxamine 5'-phosphate oxidase [Vicinamibacteria bacterium]|jgi:pyridoxamine 5'-phosphate oxidase
MRAPDPIALFRDLLEKACAQEEGDPTAVALATADLGGAPSVRMVLLKGVDAGGFVFFTTTRSRKAGDLRANPRAALCFHWPGVEMQVRVEGTVERVDAEAADAYFATRPRESQLAAWASDQSRPLGSREELIARYEDATRRFEGVKVPRPPYWCGYRLVPVMIEFWRAAFGRLHHREEFRRVGDNWRLQLLYP